jgi:microcystin-dependent protein
MDGYIGQIIMFGGNFAPRNWAFCQGQILSIAQNTALFSILGTTYGGNGQTTFALPDLRGRTAIGQGQGPGLTGRTLGQILGTETTTLLTQNMPPHNHGVGLYAETALANNGDPTGRMLGYGSGNDRIYAAPVPADEIAMGTDSIRQQTVGGGQAFNNMMPALAVNYLICLFGIFPSRN